MPEVIRGARRGSSHTSIPKTSSSGNAAPQLQHTTSASSSNAPNNAAASTTTDAAPASPASNHAVTFSPSSAPGPPDASDSFDPTSPDRRNSSLAPRDQPRKSLSYSRRAEAPAYHDSRAATKAEYRRRATTLQEYYSHNPALLPQLPFTWRHGKKRWRLGTLIFLMFVDACVLPVVLYYALAFVGDVEGWIIFAVVTTIWGGPTYLEFAVRTLRLMRKERFYRPLGTTSRWSFDMTTWASVITITAVTALFIVGSAPHIVWLRVLCMPAPAILYCLGGVLGLITLWHVMGWKSPCRISSTAKGEEVLPGAFYFMEDVVAVNAGAGRPYREAIMARYKASPRFRQMLLNQSLFWSIPAVILAIPLTVIAVLESVPAKVAYGICWVVPFIWAIIWGLVSTFWCKRDMRREREEWEAEQTPLADEEVIEEKREVGSDGDAAV